MPPPQLRSTRVHAMAAALVVAAFVAFAAPADAYQLRVKKTSLGTVHITPRPGEVGEPPPPSSCGVGCGSAVRGGALDFYEPPKAKPYYIHRGFVLDADPGPGIAFTGWTGCTASGATCATPDQK